MYRIQRVSALGIFAVLSLLLSESSILGFHKSAFVEAFLPAKRPSRILPLNGSILLSVSRNMETESSENDFTTVSGQPSYTIAGLDLSSSWVDLVRQNKVSATMSLPPTETQKSTTVEYGIRMINNNDNWIFEDYVREVGLDEKDDDDVSPNPLIANINATLTRTQQDGDGPAARFQKVGNFVAQLQLVRTLRPPPSEGFQEAISSKPPPYIPDTDSFVTGPLRLELRPLVGRLEVLDDETSPRTTTPWDVFHNISPADRCGHFLLLPSLQNKETNWRGQEFTKEDCHDLVHLASTIEPAGSVFIGYNSVGAGASQNHIHCHSWPTPNTDDDDDNNNNYPYAVSNVDKLYDFYDVDEGRVEVSYLNYPVFCVQMSSCLENLDLLGKAVAGCLEAIGEAPHNIGFSNRIYQIEGEDGEEATQEEMVEVFVFVRSKERSGVLPTLKLGVSEMMGVFHAQSEAELEILTNIDVVTNEGDGSVVQKSAMEQALGDVSYENEEELWESIVENLQSLESEP